MQLAYFRATATKLEGRRDVVEPNEFIVLLDISEADEYLEDGFELMHVFEVVGSPSLLSDLPTDEPLVVER